MDLRGWTTTGGGVDCCFVSKCCSFFFYSVHDHKKSPISNCWYTYFNRCARVMNWNLLGDVWIIAVVGAVAVSLLVNDPDVFFYVLGAVFAVAFALHGHA